MATALYHFTDRAEAGRILAGDLASYAGRVDILILALPRGGVPVAHEVARALKAPLDVWLVRKLGAPGREELAMGALAAGNVRVFNDDVLAQLRVGEKDIGAAIAREGAELERRNGLYRAGRPPPDVAGKTVIVIDDGFATGATMRAAVASLRQAGAAWIVAAAPVGAAAACGEIAEEADEVVCPFRPDPFFGVGQWYGDFSQTTDAEVRGLLDLEPPAAARA